MYYLSKGVVAFSGVPDPRNLREIGLVYTVITYVDILILYRDSLVSFRCNEQSGAVVITEKDVVCEEALSPEPLHFHGPRLIVRLYGNDFGRDVIIRGWILLNSLR
jgi:hypothetical protein